MIKNEDELKAANSVFFSAATMRFFRSRLMSPIFPTENGAYFVTSERDEGCPRLYTVRFMHDSGNMGRDGEFQGYRSRNGAMHRAKVLAKQENQD